MYQKEPVLPESEILTYCRKCGTILTNQNWIPSYKKKNSKFCRNCHNEWVRNWRHKNPTKRRAIEIRYENKHKVQVLARRRKWNQENLLKMNGKNVRVKKRPRPEKCELCPQDGSKRLIWHHWDDNHPEFGMWICLPCHIFAERQEKKFGDKYERLKKKYTRN